MICRCNIREIDLLGDGEDSVPLPRWELKVLETRFHPSSMAWPEEGGAIGTKQLRKGGLLHLPSKKGLLSLTKMTKK